MDYAEFRKSKVILHKSTGFKVDPHKIKPILKPFQRDMTVWALKKGRAAIFATTGMGKTFMLSEYARLLAEHTGGRVLIVAPLSVARQTVRLAKDMIGNEITYVRSQTEVNGPVSITNYEMVEHFEPAEFVGIVLDESSILKSLDGATKNLLIEMFNGMQYRLCCTATPAPNDIAEIANHSEFLGIATRQEMLADFFVHDDEGYRLRGHSHDRFYQWLASWGMAMSKPSDLGYSDEGYNLPPLTIEPVFVKTDYRPEGQLFFTGLKGITDRSNVRKGTAGERAEAAAEIVNADPDTQWIVWCGLDSEANNITDLIPGAVNVQGSDKLERKVQAMQDFQEGKIRVLVTKPKIAGFGMNFQNCHKMLFLGLSDSWEYYYQCIRRCYRFGQQYPVDVKIILSEIEDGIYQNVMNKEKEAKRMEEKLIEHVRTFEEREINGEESDEYEYKEREVTGEDFRMLLGDSVERLQEFGDNSIDMSVYSPPFQSLYTYSPTERDLGNSRTPDEFYTHFRFIVKELLRITKPGRISAVHVADVPAMLSRDGYIGMKDFSGDVIRLFIECGWIFDARIPIDKNQQAQSIRTHTKALTMTQLEKDRSWLRPALPDYILKFRKPGDNEVPVKNAEISRNQWIEWANPTWPSEDDRCAEGGAYSTWYGILESDTLQGWQNGREEKDERHICPLQLGTIERCIRLWTNAGETVLSPFAGIGSEGHVSIKFGRKFIGIELKESYWKQAVKNLREAERANKTGTLFDMASLTK